MRSFRSQRSFLTLIQLNTYSSALCLEKTIMQGMVRGAEKAKTKMGEIHHRHIQHDGNSNCGGG